MKNVEAGLGLQVLKKGNPSGGPFFIFIFLFFDNMKFDLVLLAVK